MHSSTMMGTSVGEVPPPAADLKLHALGHGQRRHRIRYKPQLQQYLAETDGHGPGMDSSGARHGSKSDAFRRTVAAGS